MKKFFSSLNSFASTAINAFLGVVFAGTAFDSNDSNVTVVALAMALVFFLNAYYFYSSEKRFKEAIDALKRANCLLNKTYGFDSSDNLYTDKDGEEV